MRLLTTLLILLAVARGQSASVVRFDGIGPVKVGMSLPQLNAALHEHFTEPKEKDDQGCFYLTPKDHGGVSFMIENGKLVRVDVGTVGIATAKGVQVGDSEARVKALYGSSLDISPSQYSGDEGGHYLTMRSPDQQYGIRFETEEGKVTTFYAGSYEAVQYVEGCE
jgi:hypothetical protein